MFETYEIIAKNKFDRWERQILTTLYLPIMGNEAFGLYLSLLNDAEFSFGNRNITFDQNHLEITTSMNEDSLNKARKILEALKLIETFKNINENKLFFYLYSPLDPDDFFNAPLLNNMLIARIGSDEYEKIRFLLRDASKNLSNHENISASFVDVFGEATKLPDFESQVSFTPKLAHRKLELSVEELDSIKSKLGRNDIVIEFSEQDLKLLAEVKDAYQISLEELVDGIKFAYDFKVAKLSRRKLCDKANEMIHKQEVSTDSSVKTMRSQRERAKIFEFETHTSEVYLKAKTRSRALSPTEIGLIKDLRFNHKLHDSVINALIDFSYLKNDHKIVANYILKIGATLSEKGINTPDGAMEYLKDAFKEAKTATTFKNKSISKPKQSGYVSKVDWTDEFFKDDLGVQEMNEDNMEDILRKIN
jgi:replication initiation and membrane attachment protein